MTLLFRRRRLLLTIALLHCANAFYTPRGFHALHTILRASNANEVVRQTQSVMLIDNNVLSSSNLSRFIFIRCLCNKGLHVQSLPP